MRTTDETYPWESVWWETKSESSGNFMSHIHWVTRQNKLEIPIDKDDVNKREIHECDGREHDPDTMVAPLTPKPTRKAKSLVRAPPTIVTRREEGVALKEVALPRYRCANCIFETKTKVGRTTTKTPVPVTNPNTNATPTVPKSHTHPSHECDGWVCDPEATVVPPTPKPTRITEPSTGHRRPLSHVAKKTLLWRKWYCHGIVARTVFLKLKQNWLVYCKSRKRELKAKLLRGCL